MRTRAYAAAESQIAAADTSGIRERWLYGLRLLHDDNAIAPGGGLKHGVTEDLIKAAARRRIRLSDREIRRRVQCARTYPKASQIGHAVTDFGTWRDLANANFPPYDASPDEPDADWRTNAEKQHDRDKALTLMAQHGEPTLFDGREFDPDESTVKELRAYAEEKVEQAASFSRTAEKRMAYVEELAAAVEGDESATWRAAHLAAFGTDDVDEAGEQ